MTLVHLAASRASTYRAAVDQNDRFDLRRDVAAIVFDHLREVRDRSDDVGNVVDAEQLRQHARCCHGVDLSVGKEGRKKEG